MAILNLTPDSFYDAGRHLNEVKDRDTFLYKVDQMQTDGASIIDIGAESTRPGSRPVSASEQLNRIGESISWIKQNFDILVSVDTSHSRVMREADAAGADIINDIMALRKEASLEVAAESQMGILLMHIQGTPLTMQNAPHYDNSVVTEVRDFLRQRVEACQQADITLDRIVIDPGFGFGKQPQQNLELLRELQEIQPLKGYDLPLLVGLSRKSMIAAVTASSVENRLPESLALALMAADKGACIIRVHDVKETATALKMWQAVSLES